MIYFIGLGLYFKIPNQILEEIKDFDIIIDGYTIPLPRLDLPGRVVGREYLEGQIYKDMLEKDIALLVGGDPFFATTHISLYTYAIKNNIKTKVFHNSSIINVIGRTGLSPYKFGRVVSVIKWSENYKPTSYIDYIEQNISIGLHTLVLPDPEFKDTEEFFNQFKINYPYILLGRIGYDDEIITTKKVFIKRPFSLIVMGPLNHYEQEHLQIFNKDNF